MLEGGEEQLIEVIDDELSRGSVAVVVLDESDDSSLLSLSFSALCVDSACETSKFVSLICKDANFVSDLWRFSLNAENLSF